MSFLFSFCGVEVCLDWDHLLSRFPLTPFLTGRAPSRTERVRRAAQHCGLPSACKRSQDNFLIALSCTVVMLQDSERVDPTHQILVQLAAVGHWIHDPALGQSLQLYGWSCETLA